MAAVVEHLGSVLAFLLFVAAPVPLGLWVVALREDVAKQRLSLPQVLLLLLSVWCVVEALVAHALGVLHQLRFSGVLLAELLVFGAGALNLWRLRMASPWIDRTRRIAKADALETLALLTLTFMGVTLLWWSAAMPVVNYDAWAFHMPHMAGWLQSGTFTRMAQDAQRPRNSYPYGWEALCTLFLTPFGEDMLVTFPNLFAWTLLGLATYLLARLWRARRIHALACSASLLAIPYIADPVNTMHVDMPFAALFMTSAYYGAIHARSGDRVSLGLSAATIGLACATRVTGPAYALLLATWMLFVRASSERREPLPIKAPRTPALVGFAVAILLGAFWYTKNLLEVGHVLGPGMPVAGPETVEGSWSTLTRTCIRSGRCRDAGHRDHDSAGSRTPRARAPRDIRVVLRLSRATRQSERAGGLSPQQPQLPVLRAAPGSIGDLRASRRRAAGRRLGRSVAPATHQRRRCGSLEWR